VLHKREQDGIVLLDQDKCQGIRECDKVCPYDKVCFNYVQGKSQKCIFCFPRIEQGGMWSPETIIFILHLSAILCTGILVICLMNPVPGLVMNLRRHSGLAIGALGVAAVSMAAYAVTAPGFVASSSPEELAAFLKVGRMPNDAATITGMVMPGFAWIAEQDLAALAAHVKGIAE
jgi:hypothetical protein